ncbi:MAG: hypothetical protein KKH34_03835 [Candidatus Omnitrophica bacterium]|nr:hypothetical protein [Candidatus Omnitrophota bacterium]
MLLSDEELLFAKKLYRDNKIKEAEEWLAKSLTSNANNYGAWLLKAVFDFRFKEDPKEALRSIKKAEKRSRFTFEWLYSKAFIYFWLEKYDKALKVCGAVLKQTYNEEHITLKEVEGFNLEAIKDNPAKVQLYYWIGFLNYKKENNLPKALEYLEEFEKKASGSMHMLLQRSQIYIKEIKRIMGRE